MFNLPYYLILVIPLAGSLLVPVAGKFNEKLRDWLPSIFMGIAMIFCWSLIPEINHPTTQISWPWISALGLNFTMLLDPLSVVMAVLASTLCFLIYVYSTEYMEHEGDRSRFFFLMLAFGGGMLTLVLSDNLLIAFIGWEIMGFCSYGLIGFWNDKKNPPEVEPNPIVYKNPLLQFETEGQYNSHCGTKAFVVTRIGDAFMLAGILLLFAFTGTFSFTAMAADAQQWWGVMASLGMLIPVFLLIFMGAIGKSGQAPLQVWLPEAMAGPTSVSALIHAATMVKAGIYITARFLLTMVSAQATSIQEVNTAPQTFALTQIAGANAITFFFIVVAVIGGITALMTATMGITSNELKQILAFSTLSQLGYMMLGLGTAGLLAFYGVYGEQILHITTMDAPYMMAFTASILHVISHGVFKALLFLASGGIIHMVHSKYVSRMGGLKKHMRKTFIAMWVGVLALSGIFPFSGFWSKDSIIEYAYELIGVEQEIVAHGGIVLVAVGWIVFLFSVLAAACTIFYSFRLMGLTFYGPEHYEHQSEEPEQHKEQDSDDHDEPEPEESEKHEEHGSDEHDSTPHDPGWAMMLPLYVLSAFSVIAMFVYPYVQNILLGTNEAWGAVVEEMFASKISATGLVPFALTLVALVIGGVPAYIMYIRHADRPNTFVPQGGIRRKVYTFLRHRWYINEFYYWVLYKFLSAAEWYRVKVDNKIIDGIDFGSADAAKGISRRVRWFDDHVVDGFAEGVSTRSVGASTTGQAVQTGRINDYVSVVIFGFGMLILVLLILLGVI